MPDAIGGYFELELPPGQGELYPDALRFQSARAAFFALLETGRPKRIWMPWYNCETMLEPPAMAGVEVRRYRIDEQFNIADDIEIDSRDWILYVNYFGLCDERIDRLLERLPRERVVIDNSQALFSAPRDCLATLYSPRKFFGLPDGGYLVTRVGVPIPDEQDNGSVERTTPLLTRLDRGAEAGYAGIQAARATLRGQRPKRMSTLTQRLLAHIDYPSAIERRNRNFERYHRLLGGNELPLATQSGHAALCYPFWNRRSDLHAKLAAKRIFVPRYWPNIRGESGTAEDFEFRMSTECLALPCDHRYGPNEIDYVVAALRAAIEAS
ncbi:hypothetical protein [Paraburkholderia sp. HP33-1]|uniref:hypothetical protein n=1 Tax=Paraburkholderia sp. HP33-1 TaxID=2883243 RepID=UPI001F2ACD8E|nr:hypothetical protein [Paraburkholderia sp. HP33-1]